MPPVVKMAAIAALLWNKAAPPVADRCGDWDMDGKLEVVVNGMLEVAAAVGAEVGASEEEAEGTEDVAAGELVEEAERFGLALALALVETLC